MGALLGLLTKYCVTPLGSELRCGTMDPGTAAMARSRSNSNAVRMLVSWRQNQRIHSRGLSAGLVADAFAGAGLSK
ncbi:hypothetical protein GCM10027022_19130 [Alpinimonas psychrophila]